MKEYVLTCFILLATFNLFSQDGSLDNSFGASGKVVSAIGSGDDEVRSVVIQSDGKIVVAGYSLNGTKYDFSLARYNTNGSLDNSLSTDGKVMTAVGSGDDKGYSTVIQSDGKIVIAGFSFNGSNTDFALIRYNADGSLDNSFNTNGKVTTDFGGANDEGHSVAIQNDGKLIVVGSSRNTTKTDCVLARYNTDGSLDNSFSIDGKVNTSIGNSSLAYSVVIQNDGKIVMAGYSFNGANSDFGLARYNTDGTLDSSFNTDGKVTTDFGGDNEDGNSIAIQSDGKIVVAGSSYNGANYDFALVRYNADGSLDNSFSTDGVVTTAIRSGNDFANSVAIQSNGKLIVAGNSSSNFIDNFALARYNADGTLDNSFSTDGKVTTDFGSVVDGDRGYSVAIQSDGKIVLGGYSNFGSKEDFALARYNSSSTDIENILAGKGVWVITPNPSNGVFTIQRQGKTNEIHSLEVYNVLGELIYTTTSKTINISDSPNGIYFVKIIDGENFYSIKIIKE